MDALFQTVNAYLVCVSWEEAHQIVCAHPELLSAEANNMLTMIGVDLPAHFSKYVIIPHSDILGRCREVGVEQAFAEKLAPLQVVSADLRERFRSAQASHDTTLLIQMIRDHPELHPALKREPLEPRESAPPPEFAAETREIERLKQRSDEPDAKSRLIAAYEALLARLPDGSCRPFRTTILADLAAAYAGSKNFDRAAAYYEEALRFFTPETVPLEYAFTQYNLGQVYYYRPDGTRAENEERAIACLREALRFFTPGAAPDDFARTTNLLGVVYSELLAGDIGKNLEQAIECFQAVLRYYRRGKPHASCQFSLGECFRKLPNADRYANLRRAIEHYQAALPHISPAASPSFFGRIQGSLGIAYRHLALGTDRSLLEKALECLQNARQLVDPGDAPEHFEEIQREFSRCYDDCLQLRQRLATQATEPEAIHVSRDRSPHELSAERRDPATEFMQAIGQALGDGTSPSRGAANESLSRMFGQIFGRLNEKESVAPFRGALDEIDRLHDQVEYDPAAAEALVALCERTLSAIPPEAHYVRYLVLDCLGTAYRNLPSGDAVENLNRAIECFQQALKLRSPDRSPDDFARTLNNLGNAYSNLESGDREANLDQAISCYEESLCLQTTETTPVQRGTRYLNLGSTYRKRPSGDLAASIEKAIACYVEALKYLTPDNAPVRYAGAQTSLGSAYQKRSIGNPMQNLREAAACYEEALRCSPASQMPVPHAKVQYNLGMLHMQLASADQPDELAAAVCCFQEGLQILEPEKAPRLASILLCGLGMALTQIARRADIPDYAHAVQCYEDALALISAVSAPLEYVHALRNLARLLVEMTVYDCRKAVQLTELVGGTVAELGLPPHALSVLPSDCVERIQSAIKLLTKAAPICTPTIWPRECVDVNSALGFLLGLTGRWEIALPYYQHALEAVERLYCAGISPRSKSLELASSTDLFRQAAFVAARAGHAEAAWRILDRGRTRVLADTLRTSVPRPNKVPDELWSRFQRAAAAFRAFLTPGALGDEADLSPQIKARTQAMQSATAAFEAAIEDVRQHDSEFLADINLSDLVNRLTDAKTALVAFCICEFGGMALVISCAAKESPVVVELPDFGRRDLQQLLGTAGSATATGWISSFQSHEQERWMAAIDRVLPALGSRLLRPAIGALPPDTQRIVFLSSGELALLPLHAAPIAGDAVRLCDQFAISYAPSVEVLLKLEQHAQAAASLYQIVNPTEDAKLAYAGRESAEIGRFFDDATIHVGRTATKQAVAVSIQGHSHVHFMGHGTYHWEDPPRSGIQLADGDLTLADLQSGLVDLAGIRLISLSACETGVTDVICGSPEEYVGLPAGLLLSGVSCLVSSLWPVEDIATALLMHRFYHLHRVDGCGTDVALARAQRWLRDMLMTEVASYAEECSKFANAPESAALIRQDLIKYSRRAGHAPTERPFAHPYYWAAFTVTGVPA